MSLFKKATKEKSKLRMAIIAPSGGGKTFTALSLAVSLGKRVAVIDTERGSAAKYSDKFAFDTLELESFSPTNYIMAVKAAEAEGYDVVVIDSLSHAWNGKDGALEQVDKAKARSSTGNSFTAWRDVTPLHNKLVDTIISAKMHVIATMRAKTEYVIEKNDQGKMVPRKVGMAPIQRDGMEYEFDVVADMNLDNQLIVTKTRCSVLNGAVVPKPGAELAKTLNDWLSDGVEPQPKPVHTPAAAAAQKPAQATTDAAAAGDDKGGADKAEPSTNPEDKQKFTIKGILEDGKEKDGRFGVKIMGKKSWFITVSEPAFRRAMSYKGKKVALDYSVSIIDGKQQFNLICVELVEEQQSTNQEEK